jgi:hypothetical protein
MTNAAQFLNEVAVLLDAMPDVTVVRRGIEKHEAILDITVCGSPCAMVIQRMCEGANVCLDPAFRGPEPEPDGPSTREFSICASAAAFDVFEFGYLQLLAIDIVWKLHRSGAMTTAAANEHLRRWHGAQVDDEGRFR